MLRGPNELVAYLKEKGVKRSAKTLAKYRCIGGGPKFRKFGPDVLYDDADSDEWVAELLNGPYASTSEIAA